MSDASRATEPTAATALPVAAGSGWRATEFLCTSGPGDRPFEERHEHVTIAAVLDGFFTYRSGNARAIVHSGTLLLGNAGACYECGHDHGRGDRCVSLHIDHDLFGEIAAGVAATSSFRFPDPVMNARPVDTALLAGLGATAWDPMARDAAVIGLVERVAGLMSGGVSRTSRFSARDERRVLTALAYIEAHACEKLDLADLALVADTSKYHFLRVFRRQVGVTPYRYILEIRLRRAALALVTSATPVSAVAYDIGFGDLSTFSRQFSSAFGLSPQRYRQLHRQSPLRS